ncbi:MAG TPA: TolC family protein [Candidatus Binataceae bacterium]|nr:TolC family protein [Candidatus Binataceae bacterium]
MTIRRERKGRVTQSHPAGAFIIATIGGWALSAVINGCAYFASQPEINPDRYAPSAIGQQWHPKDTTSSYEPPPVSVESGESAAGKRQPAELNQAAPSAGAETSGTSAAGAYDLASLIDLAMRNNPQERTAWEGARAAAAAYGSARAPYYPLITTESDNGYQRFQEQVPVEIGVVKQWTANPTIELTYTLIDFGRRSANAAAARERLAAAGFSFNREIQDVVFSVEQAYYGLAAAQAAVTAAIQNLQYAQADFESAGQRMNLGLATSPEYLLAKERVAQAEYDLASARLIVHDAQANLAVAAGVPANYPLPIQTLERQPLPSNLGADVDALIEDARRERPDLAASMADVRTREAELLEAKAQWYPEVEFNGAYGSNIYDYTFNGPPTIDAIDPQYQALITLKWDLFTGFKRLNDVRAAQAQSRAARAQVVSLELNAYAQVWQAYYQFQSSLTKYEYAQALINAAQESYAANSETYRQGLSTIVELLTADRDLANARYTLIQSRADLLTAAAAVAYASGSITFKPQP